MSFISSKPGLPFLMHTLVMITNTLVDSDFVQFQYGTIRRPDQVTSTASQGGQLFINTPSAIACARLCFDHSNKSCDIFVWDQDTKHCSVLKQGSLNSSLSFTSSGKFFFQEIFKCLNSLGYEVRRVDNSYVCFQFMAEQKNMYEAKPRCGSLQGSLAITDSQAKIDLVEEMSVAVLGPSTSYRAAGVGGENLEGTWLWADGRPMSPEEAKLFDFKQPDGNGPWLSIWLQKSRLDDISKDDSFYFVCEMRNVIRNQ